MKHIFGYTCFIDGSARGLPPPGNVFFQMKSRDTFAPIGPCIVTADEIADPQNLNITLTNNGQVMQKFNTSDMAHHIPRCIEWVSSIHTLEPGDILATGTNHRGLNSFMDGDKIELTVEKVGTLHFNVKDEHKRTWARTTRLQHKEKGGEGPHTPQLTGKYAAEVTATYSCHPEAKPRDLYGSVKVPRASGVTRPREDSLTGVQPGLDVLHPGLAAHEPRPAAAHRFGAPQDLVVRLVEVERLAAGLRRVERRVDIELDRIALGILEVERPGVAVVGDPVLADAFLEERLAVGLQRVERIEPEGDLVHRIVGQLLGPSVEQHELVMAFRVLGHEGDARARAAGAAVADDEAHDARVEVDHAVEVGGMHAEMRELGGKGHGFIVPPDPGARNEKGARLPQRIRG